MKPLHIAIVGATGLVGQTFLKVIEAYEIPVASLTLFASSRSLGQTKQFKGKSYPIQTIQEGSFKGIDVALFSAGKEVSKMYAHQAVREGAYVIDNSSAFRMDKDVPLVVPEVNMKDAYNHPLISNPNCSTIQCMYPLYVLQKEYGLDAVDYHTYQAVSGAGMKGVHDLYDDVVSHFPYDINKTVIPHIGNFLDDGYTDEEYKMIEETKKILHDDHIHVTATCVRVPVENGHAVSLSVTLKKDVDIKVLKETLKSNAFMTLLDDPLSNLYPTSIQANGKDHVFVGRIRKDVNHPKKILMFITADNIRKGAASNAVQIMRGLFDGTNTL